MVSLILIVRIILVWYNPECVKLILKSFFPRLLFSVLVRLSNRSDSDCHKTVQLCHLGCLSHLLPSRNDTNLVSTDDSRLRFNSWSTTHMRHVHPCCSQHFSVKELIQKSFNVGLSSYPPSALPTVESRGLIILCYYYQANVYKIGSQFRSEPFLTPLSHSFYSNWSPSLF